MLKKLISLPLLLGLLIMLPLVSSFMLPTHTYVNDQVISTYQGTSEFYELALKYPKLVNIGDYLTDLSVIYYYTDIGGEGIGKKYLVTHSPGFCVNALANAKGYPEYNVTLEESRACSVGICLHEATQDTVSHGIMVPYSIRHTLIPNQVIHVPSEQHLDTFTQSNHPEVRAEIESLTPEDWQKCIPLVKETLLGYADYQDEVISGKTDDLINAFIFEVYNSVNPESATSYDLAFKDKVSIFGKINLVPTGFLVGYISLMLLFGTVAVLTIFKKDKRLLNYIVIVLFGFFAVIMAIVFIAMLNGSAFQTIVFLVRPISNLVPIGSPQSYIDMSIENGKALFDQGESYVADTENPKIGSGYLELKQANEDIKVYNYIEIGVIILVLIWLLYLNFRRKK